MHVDDYSTSELIEELDRQAKILAKDKREPIAAILRFAATRLRQYQVIDRNRVYDALRSVKGARGG